LVLSLIPVISCHNELNRNVRGAREGEREKQSYRELMAISRALGVWREVWNSILFLSSFDDIWGGYKI
ncbi:MAG: hypothetical protein LBT65_10635, partial [Synergistaceae bacterium]|nr:hypothetical protein [Synergistaceae bacterium]